MTRLGICATLLILGLGCDGNGKGGVGVNFGNSAVLTGNPVGLGTDTPDQLTRIVPADISGEGLVGTQAVLGRTNAADTGFHFLASVTNQGNRRRCFIESETFDYLDAAGAVLGSDSSAWVEGSVGQVKDGIACTETCLDVGESGYLLALSPGTVTVESIASVRITLTSSSSSWGPPKTGIVPVAYDSPGRDKPFTVTVANQGPVLGTVAGLSHAVFFDDNGTPALWDFLLAGTITASAPRDLAPGETYVLNSSGGSNVWTGNSTRMLVLVNFRTDIPAKN